MTYRDILNLSPFIFLSIATRTQIYFFIHATKKSVLSKFISVNLYSRVTSVRRTILTHSEIEPATFRPMRERKLDLLLNVTCNDISVIYVTGLTAHRIAGGLKKKFRVSIKVLILSYLRKLKWCKYWHPLWFHPLKKELVLYIYLLPFSMVRMYSLNPRGTENVFSDICVMSIEIYVLSLSCLAMGINLMRDKGPRD